MVSIEVTYCCRCLLLTSEMCLSFEFPAFLFSLLLSGNYHSVCSLVVIVGGIERRGGIRFIVGGEWPMADHVGFLALRT